MQELEQALLFEKIIKDIGKEKIFCQIGVNIEINIETYSFFILNYDIKMDADNNSYMKIGVYSFNKNFNIFGMELKKEVTFTEKPVDFPLKFIPLTIQDDEKGENPFRLYELLYAIATYNDNLITEKLRDNILKLFKSKELKNNEVSENLILQPYPTSPATHSLNLILNGMGSLRPTRVNRNTTFDDWTTPQGEYTATFKNKQGTINITIENISELTKRYDKNAKKLFVFAMQKASQIYFNGDIVFALHELVDLGMYKTIKSARNGFLNSADKLLKITIGGETFKGKTSYKNEKGQLFIYRKVENSICTLTINPKLSTYFIAQFFTILPNWSYKLNTKAFSIAEYIFYLARQNTKTIKDKGHFNISFSAINDYLQQPSPKETHRHTEDIVTPILEAITEIEDIQESTDYKFTPFYNFNYKNATEFLKGYLQIEFTGNALSYFIERATEQEKEFEKVQKRKEKALLEVEKKKLKKEAKN